MSAARTIPRDPSEAERQAATYRYWQCQSIGDRLTAFWELSAAAYAFRYALSAK